jgi:hypothetical protein
MNEGQGNESAQLAGEIADAIQRNPDAMQALQGAGEQGNDTAAPDSSSASSTENQSGSAQGGEVGSGVADAGHQSNTAGAAAQAGEEGNGLSGAVLEQGAGDAASQDTVHVWQFSLQGSAMGAAGGDLGNGQPSPNISGGAASGSALAFAAGEDPNADASPAASDAAAGEPSSAGDAPPSQDTAAGSSSAFLADPANMGAAERARGKLAVAKIRAFLWSYNEPDVSHLHRELDALAAIFA